MQLLSIARSVLAAGALFLAAQASAAVLQINGSGILTGATGVTVGAATYDVEFKDGTCIDLFGGCNAGTPFIFPDFNSATLAEIALSEQVFPSQGRIHPELINGCQYTEWCRVMFPIFYQPESAPYFILTAALYVKPWHLYNDATYEWMSPSTDSTTSKYNTWAVWTAVATQGNSSTSVPEPSSIALFAFALLGFAMARRRAK